jgi:hypothetical protein
MRIHGIVTAISLVLLGCAAVRSGPSDDWLHPVPQQLEAPLFQSGKTLAVPVADEKRRPASEMLAATSLVKLSLEEAEGWVKVPLHGGQYFLVRGLCLGCATGSFRAYFDGKNVVIYHHSLAKRGTPLTRWPVVVKLENQPEEVFVECSASR